MEFLKTPRLEKQENFLSTLSKLNQLLGSGLPETELNPEASLESLACILVLLDQIASRSTNPRTKGMATHILAKIHQLQQNSDTGQLAIPTTELEKIKKSLQSQIPSLPPVSNEITHGAQHEIPSKIGNFVAAFAIASMIFLAGVQEPAQASSNNTKNKEPNSNPIPVALILLGGLGGLAAVPKVRQAIGFSGKVIGGVFRSSEHSKVMDQIGDVSKEYRINLPGYPDLKAMLQELDSILGQFNLRGSSEKLEMQFPSLKKLKDLYTDPGRIPTNEKGKVDPKTIKETKELADEAKKEIDKWTDKQKQAIRYVQSQIKLLKEINLPKNKNYTKYLEKEGGRIISTLGISTEPRTNLEQLIKSTNKFLELSPLGKLLDVIPGQETQNKSLLKALQGFREMHEALRLVINDGEYGIDAFNDDLTMLEILCLGAQGIDLDGNKFDTVEDLIEKSPSNTTARYLLKRILGASNAATTKAGIYVFFSKISQQNGDTGISAVRNHIDYNILNNIDSLIEDFDGYKLLKNLNAPQDNHFTKVNCIPHDLTTLKLYPKVVGANLNQQSKENILANLLQKYQEQGYNIEDLKRLTDPEFKEEVLKGIIQNKPVNLLSNKNDLSKPFTVRDMSDIIRDTNGIANQAIEEEKGRIQAEENKLFKVQLDLKLGGRMFPTIESLIKYLSSSNNNNELAELLYTQLCKVADVDSIDENTSINDLNNLQNYIKNLKTNLGDIHSLSGAGYAQEINILNINFGELKKHLERLLTNNPNIDIDIDQIVSSLAKNDSISVNKAQEGILKNIRASLLKFFKGQKKDENATGRLSETIKLAITQNKVEVDQKFLGGVRKKVLDIIGNIKKEQDKVEADKENQETINQNWKEFKKTGINRIIPEFGTIGDFVDKIVEEQGNIASKSDPLLDKLWKAIFPYTEQINFINNKIAFLPNYFSGDKYPDFYENVKKRLQSLAGQLEQEKEDRKKQRMENFFGTSLEDVMILGKEYPTINDLKNSFTGKAPDTVEAKIVPPLYQELMMGINFDDEKCLRKLENNLEKFYQSYYDYKHKESVFSNHYGNGFKLIKFYAGNPGERSPEIKAYKSKSRYIIIENDNFEEITGEYVYDLRNNFENVNELVNRTFYELFTSIDDHMLLLEDYSSKNTYKELKSLSGKLKGMNKDDSSFHSSVGKFRSLVESWLEDARIEVPKINYTSIIAAPSGDSTNQVFTEYKNQLESIKSEILDKIQLTKTNNSS